MGRRTRLRVQTVQEKAQPTKKRRPILRNMTQGPIGCDVKDPFFDNGRDELLTAHAIVDMLGLHERNVITITFDKKYLRNVLQSHIEHIRGLNAIRH